MIYFFSVIIFFSIIYSPSAGVKFVPAEVSQLVLDFSGGSYFWVREILHFIQEHGQETFMDALGEAAVPVGTEGEDNHLSRLLRIKAPSSNAYGYQTRGGSKVFIQHDFESAPSASNLQPPLRRSSSMGHSLTAVHEQKVVSPKHKQLDHLLLIRFGNLPQEEQRILRKASVIGVAFSAPVLHHLLSPHLQEQLMECLETLVNQKWIFRDITIENTYEFVHGHVRQLLYDLTPPSERNNLHKLVAEYLVANHPDDKAQFIHVWYHNTQFDPERALEFGAKAAVAWLEAGDLYDLVDCMDVLVNNVVFCTTRYDTYVLQQLTERLQGKIEAVLIDPQVQCKTRQNLVRKFKRLFCIPNNRTSPTCPYRMEGIIADLPVKEMKVNESADRKACAFELDRLRTRAQLLEKVDSLRFILSEKSAELKDACLTSDPLSHQPKLWQRAYLESKS